MIEIKRWDTGAVIYTAENAQDVRSALEEAALARVDLYRARLDGASLDRASLDGASLVGARLDGASPLPFGADSWRHPLWPTRQDIFSILDQAPAEVAALREAIVEGKINGSTYNDGECGCLCGTIGIVHAGATGGSTVLEAIEDLGIQRDGSRPAEQWFIDISLGDKPLDVADESIDWSEQTESVFRISWALVWVDEWIKSRTAIAKALATA